MDDVNYGLGSGARLWGRGGALVRLLELTRESTVLWLICEDGNLMWGQGTQGTGLGCMHYGAQMGPDLEALMAEKRRLG